MYCYKQIQCKLKHGFVNTHCCSNLVLLRFCGIFLILCLRNSCFKNKVSFPLEYFPIYRVMYTSSVNRFSVIEYVSNSIADKSDFLLLKCNRA